MLESHRHGTARDQEISAAVAEGWARLMTHGLVAWRSRSQLPTQRPSCRCDSVPHLCPRNITTMIRMHTLHREPPATRAAPHQAQPSQREGQDQGSTTESLHFARIAATVLLRTLLTRYRVHSHSAELRLTPLITLRPSAEVCAALTDNVAGGLSALPACRLAVDNRRHNAGHSEAATRGLPLLWMTRALGYRLQGLHG